MTQVKSLVRERLARATPTTGDGQPPAELTRRQLEILRLLAGGMNTRTMAEKLHVSPATIRNHIQNILQKLGAHSRLEAAAYASRRGLL